MTVQQTPLPAAANAPSPGRNVRARQHLDRAVVAERAGVSELPDRADQVEALYDLVRRDAANFAEQLALAAAFYVGRDDLDPRGENRDAEMSVEQADVAAATAARSTTARAAGLISDGHRALTHLPALHARLADGALPADWFRRILRTTRDLAADQLRLLDGRVSAWDLESIPCHRFTRELSRLVTWLSTSAPLPADQSPQALRSVAITGTDPAHGIATLEVRGPIPEILSLTERLDAAAREIQKQQRTGLGLRHPDTAGSEPADPAGAGMADTGEAGLPPIPFDIDGQATRTGRPLSRTALRYALMTRSILDTGSVETPPDRFRINVTVPAMTLLGESDAPGMLEGTTPIPAELAKLLAGAETTWYRVLTDPVSGRFLPLPADTYRPTSAMLEHLRLRHPVCAAPGCRRSTRLGAEADHIIEYDHTDPARGGPTSIDNLHLLCWWHHRLKTRGYLDPERASPPARGPSLAASDLGGEEPAGPPRHSRPSDRPAPDAPPPDGSAPATADFDLRSFREAATTWQIGPHAHSVITDNQDLATPHVTTTLNHAWTSYLTLEERRRARSRDATASAGPEKGMDSAA